MKRSSDAVILLFFPPATAEGTNALERIIAATHSQQGTGQSFLAIQVEYG